MKIAALPLAAALAGLPVMAAHAQDLTLRVTHVLSTTEPMHLASERFAELVEERSKGRIAVEVFPAGQLGSNIDMYEQVRMGAPIVQYQGVSFPIVEFETLLAACRQLCYHGLALRDAGQPHTAEAAMVKWMGPKTSFDAIHQCILTFGHYGWSKDLPHQQRLRDVMGLEIGDGTAQVMKLIVARERAGRVAVQYAAENKK